MPTASKTLAGLAVLLLAITWVQRDEQPGDGRDATSAPATSTGGRDAAGVEPTGPAGHAERPDAETDADVSTGRPGPLLHPVGGGDGDSWRDTNGVEYRLGLVNTPEHDECYGPVATRAREALTAEGFYAHVYTRDRYGRSVAVVTTASGIDVNVHLARHGLADDTYLEQFRGENPGLARRLDGAFAAARAEQAGLWGACSSARAGPGAPVPQAEPSHGGPPAPPAEGCHPDYLTCVPVRGDGSGRGGANDVDCGSLGHTVVLNKPGVDAYRLDGDGDGYGCD